MDNRTDFKTIWHAAGVPGIVLAAVCTAYMLANYYIGKADFSLSGAVIFLLDLAKIVACIYLMYLFMSRFHENYPDAGRNDVRRMGKWVGILSALVFSAAMMAFYKIHPEVVTEAIDTFLDTYGDDLDTNAMNALEQFGNNFQNIFFISNFLYCSIFGWVLSAILSIRIVPDNPFAGDEEIDNEADEQ